MGQDTKTDALAKDVATTGTRSAVAGTLAALAGQPPEMIIATALSQFVPFVAGLVFGVAWNAKKAEAERWWAEFLRQIAEHEGVTVEEVEERVRSRADEPYVREAIFRSLRALLEAVDDAATVPLAQLVAHYHTSKQKPDAFFRGMARLLAELSGQEIVDLRRLVNWAVESTTSEVCTLVALDRDAKGGNAEDWPRVPWRVEDS